MAETSTVIGRVAVEVLATFPSDWCPISGVLLVGTVFTENGSEAFHQLSRDIDDLGCATVMLAERGTTIVVDTTPLLLLLLLRERVTVDAELTLKVGQLEPDDMSPIAVAPTANEVMGAGGCTTSWAAVVE